MCPFSLLIKKTIMIIRKISLVVLASCILFSFDFLNKMERTDASSTLESIKKEYIANLNDTKEKVYQLNSIQRVSVNIDTGNQCRNFP